MASVPFTHNLERFLPGLKTCRVAAASAAARAALSWCQVDAPRDLCEHGNRCISENRGAYWQNLASNSPRFYAVRFV